MANTNFAERLQRIEQAQAQPVSKRFVAGVCEELEREARGVDSKRSGLSAASIIGTPVRLGVGFFLVFCACILSRNMADVQHLLEGYVALAPFVTAIMTSIVVMLVFLALVLAFKFQRALLRALSEPARLPFAFGMVIGLALGVGPTELTDTMMAQLN